MLLEDQRDIVRDILPFPPHSKRSPAFTGNCEVNGRAQAEIIVAVLDNRDYDRSDKAVLPAA